MFQTFKKKNQKAQKARGKDRPTVLLLSTPTSARTRMFADFKRLFFKKLVAFYTAIQSS